MMMYYTCTNQEYYSKKGGKGMFVLFSPQRKPCIWKFRLGCHGLELEISSLPWIPDGSLFGSEGWQLVFKDAQQGEN